MIRDILAAFALGVMAGLLLALGLVVALLVPPMEPYE